MKIRSTRYKRLLFVAVSVCGLTMAACSHKEQRLPRSFVAQTYQYHFRSSNVESVLYLPPLASCPFLHAFRVEQKQATEVRIYAVDKSILPDGKDAIKIYNSHEGDASTSQQAAAVLGDARTKILYVGNRSLVSVSLPIGSGLALANSQTLMLEVHRPVGETHLQVSCLTGKVEPITVLAKLKRIFLDPELPMAGSVQFALPKGARLVWAGVIAGGPVAKISLTINGQQIPFAGSRGLLPDLVFPDLRLDIRKPPHLDCVFAGGSGKLASCGAVLYVRGHE